MEFITESTEQRINLEEEKDKPIFLPEAVDLDYDDEYEDKYESEEEM